MQQQRSTRSVSVTWRGRKFILDMNLDATVKDLGYELQKLTDVKADTMRLIVRQASDKSSKLLSPFSDEHSCLNLQESSFFEGKSIRMMGVPENEVDEILQNAKANLRIAGFEEEEKRQRQRALDRPHSSLKLPQGNYVFCEFRTLHIPGVELNPPASEALKRMHMLAADPGIVAVMNKHRWLVGIMTEMAPVGYVGVSPKCVLGFNKNRGEEISLRLRTDDLKGFRKYESIKKTLLHELAHMVYSEHDANFYALDKQLNEEAATLDWTRSKSHSLSGVRHSELNEEYFVDNRDSFSQKLGGKKLDLLVNARATSVAAAYRRLESASPELLGVSKVHQEPDHDDFELNDHQEPEPMDIVVEGKLNVMKNEPDPDDIKGGDAMVFEPSSESSEGIISLEPDPDGSEASSKYRDKVDSHRSLVTEPVNHHIQQSKIADELYLEDSKAGRKKSGYGKIARPCHGLTLAIETIESKSQQIWFDKEPDPDDSQASRVGQGDPDPDNKLVTQQGVLSSQTDEPDLDDQELQRIQDPVNIIFTRLQKAIAVLQSEVNPSDVSGVFQTLFKIVRNLVEHPNEMKFKKIRKANPVITKNVANYKAAMEILFLIGFNEDVLPDEIGKAETYLVLKRNDPGLLWLAKSSLETCIAY